MCQVQIKWGDDYDRYPRAWMIHDISHHYTWKFIILCVKNWYPSPWKIPNSATGADQRSHCSIQISNGQTCRAIFRPVSSLRKFVDRNNIQINILPDVDICGKNYFNLNDEYYSVMPEVRQQNNNTLLLRICSQRQQKQPPPGRHNNTSSSSPLPVCPSSVQYIEARVQVHPPDRDFAAAHARADAPAWHTYYT